MSDLHLPDEFGPLGPVGRLITARNITDEALDGPADVQPGRTVFDADALPNLVDDSTTEAARRTGGAVIHLPEQRRRNLRDVDAAPSLGVSGQPRGSQSDMGGGFPLSAWQTGQLGLDEQGRTVTRLHDHS